LAATVSVGVQAAGAAATAGTRAVASDVARRARRGALTCSGAVALTKRKLIHWLLTHDFEELPRRATSHRRFRGSGTTITVPAHGRLELSAKHTGMLIRELEKAGFDRDQIREELGL
jgi:predicted RNA binding protein YcfA (HicA-like mRNA interferase family)